MLRLHYTVDYTAALLDLAAQVIAVLRMQDHARQAGLRVEESHRSTGRRLTLVIPAERVNDVLSELDLAGVLRPTQEIMGPPALHARLEERFSTLTWVDC